MNVCQVLMDLAVFCRSARVCFCHEVTVSSYLISTRQQGFWCHIYNLGTRQQSLHRSQESKNWKWGREDRITLFNLWWIFLVDSIEERDFSIFFFILETPSRNKTFNQDVAKKNQSRDYKIIFTFWFVESVCHFHCSWLAGVHLSRDKYLKGQHPIYGTLSFSITILNFVHLARMNSRDSWIYHHRSTMNKQILPSCL